MILHGGVIVLNSNFWISVFSNLFSGVCLLFLTPVAFVEYQVNGWSTFGFIAFPVFVGLQVVVYYLSMDRIYAELQWEDRWSSFQRCSYES